MQRQQMSELVSRWTAKTNRSPSYGFSALESNTTSYSPVNGSKNRSGTILADLSLEPSETVDKNTTVAIKTPVQTVYFFVNSQCSVADCFPTIRMMATAQINAPKPAR